MEPHWESEANIFICRGQCNGFYSKTHSLCNYWVWRLSENIPVQHIIISHSPSQENRNCILSHGTYKHEIKMWHLRDLPACQETHNYFRGSSFIGNKLTKACIWYQNRKKIMYIYNFFSEYHAL